MHTIEEDYKESNLEMVEASRAPISVALIRSLQIERGFEACFLTDKRLHCQDRQCEWRRECCRLVAVWRR